MLIPLRTSLLIGKVEKWSTNLQISAPGSKYDIGYMSMQDRYFSWLQGSGMLSGYKIRMARASDDSPDWLEFSQLL